MAALPETCPWCEAKTSDVAVGVGANDDGTTFIHCACGYVLDGTQYYRMQPGRMLDDGSWAPVSRREYEEMQARHRLARRDDQWCNWAGEGGPAR